VADDELKQLVREELERVLAKDPKAAFDAEIAELQKQPRRSPSALRAIQAKFREAGLSESDLDVNPAGKEKGYNLAVPNTISCISI